VATNACPSLSFINLFPMNRNLEFELELRIEFNYSAKSDEIDINILICPLYYYSITKIIYIIIFISELIP